MRFLVTGANGLVGSRSCRLLASSAHDVFGTGRGPLREGSVLSYLACDLTDRDAVEGVFADVRPEVVLHPASMTEVDACERSPSEAWAANVEATANVARAARLSGAHLVHVSTDYVFDGEAGPYLEDDIPKPRGTYARTKLAAEVAAATLCPGATIARTAVVYGWPSPSKMNFGAWLVSQLSAGKEVRLFEDQVVTPTYVDNVSSMLIELGERRLGGIWHAAGATAVDRVTFGRALCDVFGLDARLITPSLLADAGLSSPRPRQSALKTDKAAAGLAATPWTLSEQLARFHADWTSFTGIGR